MSLPHPQGPVTGGRSVRFRLDVPDYMAVQQPYALTLMPNEIATGSNSALVNCENTKVGIQIAPMDVSAISQTSFGDDVTAKAIADGGTLIVAPGMKGYLNWRKPTELTGADTGSWTEVTNQSDYFLEKTVPAGGNWADCNLTADLAARPDPVDPSNWAIIDKATDGSFYQMDRVIVDSGTSRGGESYVFRFAIPGQVQATPDYLLIFHFAGPRGTGKTYTGTGNYALTMDGNGLARLFELGFKPGADPGWIDMNFQFQYSPQSQVSGKTHRIAVIPYVFPAPLNGVGGTIYFQVTTGDGAATKSGTSTTHMFHNQSDPSAVAYHVKTYNDPAHPTPQDKPAFAVPCPVRVSQRRDQRPKIQMSKLSYILNGFIVTDPFQLMMSPVSAAQDPDLAQPIEVTVTAHLPAGSSMAIDLFDCKDGAVDPKDLSSVGLPIVDQGMLENGGGAFATFAPVDGSWTYQVRILLAFGSGLINDTPSPVVTSVQVNMDGVYENYDPGEFVLTTYPSVVEEFSFSGAGADPTHETGKATCCDLAAQFSRLTKRGRFRTVVDTTYPNDAIDWTDPSNDWKRPWLFRGFTVANPGERRGSDRPNGITAHGAHVAPSDIAAFPNPRYRKYEFSMLGEWKRVSESLPPFGFNFAIDPSSGIDGLAVPYLATTAIAMALTWAGYPLEMIDIGPGTTNDNADIRLFSNGQTDAQTLTPGQDILEWCMATARDYLGQALIFDANATKSGPAIADKGDLRGCWRLAKTAVEPYNVLADFVTEPPHGMVGNLVHMLRAYPTRNSPQGNTVQTVPVWKGSIVYDPKPPECNLVIVSGSGEMNVAQGANEVGTLNTAWIANPKSFDYLLQHTADPDDADFIGTVIPAYRVDVMQVTDFNSAAFIARRFYDLSCHGLTMVHFTGPLVLVTDVTDPKQCRPRPLYFQDAVTLDGDVYIVRECAIHFDKDYMMYATYTLQEVTWPFLNPTGAV